MRINVEVDADLTRDLYLLVPWGIRATLIRILLRAVIQLVKKYGVGALGPILDERFELTLTVPIERAPVRKQ
jgi:hypothetical protein